MVTTTKPYDLKDQILELKKKINAIILVHNYQVGEIQDIADFVGDSLGLAFQAKKTDADVIVFCGVHFMAETAKIVNPNKTVILPDSDAGCSLEQSCDGNQLESFLEENSEKNYYVIAYINCSAHVKALSDCICTSGNAVKIVASAPQDRPILFVPDQNLGSWVMEQTGRKMDLWKGSCYVHVEYTRESILKIREEFPNDEIIWMTYSGTVYNKELSIFIKSYINKFYDNTELNLAPWKKISNRLWSFGLDHRWFCPDTQKNMLGH